MALAIHEGGPADGMRERIDKATPFRQYLPAGGRKARVWLMLARYVFVPPRDGARCLYRYTGTHQVCGPAPGDAEQPDWSW